MMKTKQLILLLPLFFLIFQILSSEVGIEFVPGVVTFCFDANFIGNSRDEFDIWQENGVILTPFEWLNDLAVEFQITNLTRKHWVKNQEWNLNGKYPMNIFRIETSSHNRSNELIEALLQNEYILFAEPETIYRTYSIPNDPNIDFQWHLENIKAFDAWTIETGKSDIIIGIRFFPNMNKFILDPVFRYERQMFDDATEHIISQENDLAKAKFLEIIDIYPESEFAIKSMTVLPFLNNALAGDVQAMLAFYESLLSDDTLGDVALSSMAYTNMLESDYHAAIDIFAQIIENPPGMAEKIVAEVDQAYCFMRLVESNARNLPSHAVHQPRTYKEFRTLQKTALDQIFYLKDETDENQTDDMPKTTFLANNYPNPFNPSTMISFDMATEGHVRIDIYNIRGQRVQTVANEHFGIGRHTVEWNGTDESGRGVASGIYFYRMNVGEFVQTRRMVLMK